MASLVGRTAIVTGASAGLGLAITQELASRGARVLMCSRDKIRLNKAAKQIASYLTDNGPSSGARKWYTPLTMPGDITEPETADRLAEMAKQAFGGIDILICNAGGPPPGNFDECSDEMWQNAFNLILQSPIRTIRSCLPLLQESEAGRVVFIASISGYQPVPRLLLSNTLRPGLMGLTKHLASEFAEDGILVNAIAPGFFDTDRSREVMQSIADREDETLSTIQKRITDRIPLGRQGKPAELGHLVSYLVSMENSFITGQTVPVDGGFLISP